MRCAFGQLCKPNTNSKTNPDPNPALTVTLFLTLTLTLLQVCCMIDQILHNSSNAVQLVNIDQWHSAFGQMCN